MYKVGIVWQVYSRRKKFVQPVMGKKQLYAAAVAKLRANVRNLNVQLVTDWDILPSLIHLSWFVLVGLDLHCFLQLF